MNYKVPDGVRVAAQALLAEGSRLNVHQVHQITLREIDANAEDPVRCVTLIPLGGVVGICVHREGEWPADADITFVSAAALGNTLPALGFTARQPAVAIVAPLDARDQAE